MTEMVQNPDETAVPGGQAGAVIHRQEFFAGPLPPPELIEKYERILPGAADRIIMLAEKEQAHRHRLESDTVSARIADRTKVHATKRRGQWLGIVVVLLAFSLAGTVALILRTNESLVFAGTLCGVTLVGLVSVFVVGRTIKPRDQERATQQFEG